MSYKTEIQSNNTDIQTITKYVDEFGNLIAGQNNLIAQMQTALQGKAIVNSGEASVNDIGVFTFSGTGDTKHLFIKGMTFGEWLNSKMNVTFYVDSDLIWNFYLHNNGYIFAEGDNDYYCECPNALTTDGITLVTPNTIIEEINYIPHPSVEFFN